MKADKLREKARELLKKAEEVESAKALKVGQSIMKHYKAGFKGVTIQQIAEEVSLIVTPKSRESSLKKEVATEDL